MKFLLSKYSITAEGLQERLGVRKDSIERFLHALQIKGIILLEPLLDKTYIRLTRTCIEFVGRFLVKKRALKHKKAKKEKVEKVKEQNVMYG